VRLNFPGGTVLTEKLGCPHFEPGSCSGKLHYCDTERIHCRERACQKYSRVHTKNLCSTSCIFRVASLMLDWSTGISWRRTIARSRPFCRARRSFFPAVNLNSSISSTWTRAWSTCPRCGTLPRFLRSVCRLMRVSYTPRLRVAILLLRAFVSFQKGGQKRAQYILLLQIYHAWFLVLLLGTLHFLV